MEQPSNSQTSKTRTYIFYAIGEIALVMIGILLALQVNNWNENRSARDYEETVLIELKNAALADIDNIMNYLIGYRGAERERAHAYFDRLVMGEKAHPDSLQDHYGWLLYSDTFQYNSGPYESIKSSGLDRISHDSLRSKIANVYDFSLPRSKELIYWRFSVFDEEVDKQSPYLREGPKPFMVDGEVEIMHPYKMIDFSTNEHFLYLYDQAKNAYSFNKQRYILSANQLQEMVKLIDVALGIKGTR